MPNVRPQPSSGPRSLTRLERKLAHAIAARDAAEARIADLRRHLEARLPAAPGAVQ